MLDYKGIEENIHAMLMELVDFPTMPGGIGPRSSQELNKWQAELDTQDQKIKEKVARIVHYIGTIEGTIRAEAQSMVNAEELAVFREAQNAYISSTSALTEEPMEQWAIQAVNNFRRFRHSLK